MGDGDGVSKARQQRSGEGDGAYKVSSPTAPPQAVEGSARIGGGAEARYQCWVPEEIPRGAVDPTAMVEAGGITGR